ncbi:MAG: hypothetical protein FWF12_00595 [Betaproteobacteria bacterium]|nr:hypothetical protein [Betaproteobacteria bacterium]
MTPRAVWLGNFYGGNLGFLNYEVLTIGHIPHKDLKCEPDLMASKWFDYRRLHPMQATYYFIKCYNNAYREFYRKAVDADRAPFVRGIKDHDFLTGKEKLTFWRLRQNCDRVGLPYDFFLRFAMHRHMRLIVCGKKIYAPRPAMFVKNEDLFADAMIAWEDARKASLRVATDPYYQVSNYTGSGDQEAHEAFVIEQIKERPIKHYALHSAMYFYDVVRIEEALRCFDVRVVDSAIKEGSSA